MNHTSVAKYLLFVALAMPIAAGTLLSGCAESKHHESTGQYIDDSTITTKVKAAILDDPDLHVTQVNVETYQGVVQLSGFVDDHSQIKKAEQDARNVEGVRSVKNDLRVK